MAKGAIAAGHELTAAAAEMVLNDGGNAFDAIVAAFFTACVSEPVLASPGGGGFLLAQRAGAEPVIYDFFTQTPRARNVPVEDIDFRCATVDFGTATQDFYIGHGSIATPGVIRGLFEIEHDLCSMSMRQIVQPALACARNGVRVNDFQAYIFNIVSPILLDTQAARRVFGRDGEQVYRAGDHFRCTDFADTLEILAIEGPDLFYRGEIAHSISTMCRDNGGYLRYDDLRRYAAVKRHPLAVDYRDTVVFTNPPPSSGGILIGFALKLFSVLHSLREFAGPDHLTTLAQVMRLTQKARLDAINGDANTMLDEAYLRVYQQQVQRRASVARGTTHISVIDAHGNIASMSVSNGEGCGAIVPRTGIMLNNMLGEADLHPQGLHTWTPDQRMASMMAPSIVQWRDGRQLALGSGGSNRIRTALLQVLLNIIDFELDAETAVCSPRIHVEGTRLSIESGFSEATVRVLTAAFDDHELWEERNLFFGGVHCVLRSGERLSGCGDPRRGGVSRIVT